MHHQDFNYLGAKNAFFLFCLFTRAPQCALQRKYLQLARKNLSVAINNSNRGSDTSSSCNKYILLNMSRTMREKIREKDSWKFVKICRRNPQWSGRPADIRRDSRRQYKGKCRSEGRFSSQTSRRRSGPTRRRWLWIFLFHEPVHRILIQLRCGLHVLNVLKGGLHFLLHLLVLLLGGEQVVF